MKAILLAGKPDESTKKAVYLLYLLLFFFFVNFIIINLGSIVSYG
jgi:hypothetical protein